MDKKKRFESLDDIEKKLFQKNPAGSSENKIKNKKKTAKDIEISVMDFLRDYSRLLVIPAVSILLIIIIMAAEAVTGTRPGADGGSSALNAVNEQQDNNATLSEAAHADAPDNGEDTGETEPEESGETDETGLTLCGIDGIDRLVNDYFYARLNDDVDTLYSIFKRENETGREELEKKLEAESSWIQSFDGIKTYLIPGIDENGYVAIITYKINFRRTDTMAPGIMYCYISRAEDGSWYIEENLLKDKVDYIEKQLEDPKVSALIDETDAELKEALNSDSNLALIYTSFNNGEIYKEQDLDVNREQEVDILFTPEGSDLTGGLATSSNAVIEINSEQ